MKTIFTGLITFCLCVNSNATPLKIWEVGGEFHDIHLTEYSWTKPNTNPEKEIIYFNASADNAGLTNNAFRIPNTVQPETGSLGLFLGSQGQTITPDSSFQFGSLNLYRLGLVEGDIPLDVQAMFYPSSGTINETVKVNLSLLLHFRIYGEGEDRTIAFTQTSDDANFSVNGEDYIFSFESACQLGDSPINCPTDMAWLTPGETESRFTLTGTLRNKSADVPEPAPFSLLFAGLLAIAATRFRKHV